MFNTVDDMADRISNGDNTAPAIESCNGDDEILDIQALKENPLFSPFFNHLEIEQKEKVKQARDSLRVFNNERKCAVSMFLKYPNSPTAVNFGRAFFHFTLASQIIEGYTKDRIDDTKDCDALSSAFENIVRGYLLENSMFDPFRPPEKTSVLVDQYLKLRPKDICAEYVKILILMRGSCNSNKGGNTLLSDFESGKLRIQTSEKFAAKLSSNVDVHPLQRQVLANVYYFLGAIYVSTNQPERALDSFKKCYDLDNTHFGSLYGIAYHYKTSNPAKAIKLFLKYISMAPKCDKQYPNAYYMIASAYVMQDNFEEGFRYCSLAEEAEKIRLPFLPPVSVPQKSMMHTLKQLFAQKELLEKQKSIE